MANDHTDHTGADWADVTDALNALGASISKAARGAVDDVESRRRMRELAEGLAGLAHQLGVTVDLTEPHPAVVEVEHAAARAADAVLLTAEDAAECVVDNVPPEVLSAIESANEKFRQAAAQWEKTSEPVAAEPVAGAATSEPGASSAPVPAAAPEAAPAPIIDIPEEPAGVTGAIGAIGGRVASLFGGSHSEPEPEEEGEQSISDWLFPEGEPAVDDAVPSAPVPHGAAAIGSAAEPEPAVASEPAVIEPEPAARPGEPASATGIDAVRIAHERFLAERKIAEEAAAAAREHATGATHKPTRTRRPKPPSDDASLW